MTNDHQRQSVYVIKAQTASTFMQKLRGLIGTEDSAHCGDALCLTDCASVHTYFMKYSIDIAFLDERDLVIKVLRSVSPRQVIRGGRSARSTLERKASQSAWPTVGQQIVFNQSVQDRRRRAR